jgi:protein-disulfide isomerase
MMRATAVAIATARTGRAPMRLRIDPWRCRPAVLALGAALALAAPMASAQDSVATETADTLDQAEIEAIIRAYLLEHPEVVVEALQAFEAKRAAAEQARSREVITALLDQLNDNPLSPVGGNPDGDVTIVEFFDYNCPYCKQEAPAIAELLESDGEIRFVYKEWPILSPESEVAARAALAAWQQDEAAYVRFHDAMMAHRGKLDRDTVMAIAASEGLNIERLAEDMESGPVEAELEHVRNLANQIGINGTPAYVIDGELVPGAVGIEELRKMVAAARAS